MSELVGAEGSNPSEPIDLSRINDPHLRERLESLSDLDQRPVDEHVAVFETAHEALRAALARGATQQ